MINSEVSGVVNTKMSARDTDIMEIEAAWGQGEPLVSGVITPDTYYVNKQSMTLIDRSISTQLMIMTGKGTQPLYKSNNAQKLQDKQIIKLAKVCRDIEGFFESPQDIVYAFCKEKLFILQARPQTGLDVLDISIESQDPTNVRLIATGLKGKVGAKIQGVAKVLHSLGEAYKLKDGEILVAGAVTPAWDPVMYRAAALITDEGGPTSHAIRVANERRIPTVVGTGEASKIIKDQDIILVDTTHGDSFRGRIYKIYL
jgi:pyruvate,water dikinase